jgi:hypothetical protein
MRTMRPSPAGRDQRALWGCVAALGLSLLPLPAVADEGKPAAAAAVAGTTVADDDYRATTRIPKRLLRHVLGCWQLDGQERWMITRLDASGAQVVTKPMKSKVRPAFPDRARRAAVPATLMFDARKGNFGFASAGRRRPTLVVFSQAGATLQASLYAKPTRRGRYAATGDTATLERCKVRKGPSRARRHQTPPRLR